MIIRMYPIYGLKGQKALSPGPLDLWSLARQERPGYKRKTSFALQGQKHGSQIMLLFSFLMSLGLRFVTNSKLFYHN